MEHNKRMSSRFLELLQNSRLPPVPEEGTDEMIKSVDYGFSSIMGKCFTNVVPFHIYMVSTLFIFTGSEQMDSSNMMDVSSSNVVASMANVNEDANMMELNTPMNALHYSEIEQQFAARGNNNNAQMMAPTGNRTNQPNIQTIRGNDSIMSNTQQNTNSLMLAQGSRQSQHQQQQMEAYDNSGSGGAAAANALGIMDNSNTISNNNSSSGGSMTGRQSSGGNDFPVKKGRISKSSQRPFR